MEVTATLCSGENSAGEEGKEANANFMFGSFGDVSVNVSGKVSSSRENTRFLIGQPRSRFMFQHVSRDKRRDLTN